MENFKIRYPLGRQDFASLRKDGCLYVDKTAIMYDLIDSYKYVFLSRPRRFGKSLLLSTIKAYFEAKREYFRGLQICNLQNQWIKYPVLHLDLSRINSGEENSLKAIIKEQFEEWEKLYKITVPQESMAARLTAIIKQAFAITGEKVVILIDEYDNPLINTLHIPERHSRYQDLLKSIYSVIKPLDEYIRFAMITGVSRFSKTSIFSGLNNLTDITFENRYSAICGFTESEIRTYLWAGVKLMAQKENKDPENIMTLLKDHYDGYHFTEELEDIYNPFSLLNCLDTGKIKDYWFMSGMPEFLLKKIKEAPISFKKLFNPVSKEQSLEESDTAFKSPVALLYQTGYLTIKSVNERQGFYNLGIPNKEVENSLFTSLLGELNETDRYEADQEIYNLSQYLRNNNPEEFLERLKSFIAGIPYTVRKGETEQFFQRNFFIILKTLGLHVHTEFETSDGRIDILVETHSSLFIIELKANSTAGEALDQIERKQYSLPWKNSGKKIFEIGVNFSSETRNISEWKIREI